MTLLQMSLYGAVMIFAIIIIRAITIHKLPKRVFLLLWSIALLRLLVPFEISSAFSVYSLLPEEQTLPAATTQTALQNVDTENTPFTGFNNTPVTLPDTAGSAFSIRTLPLLWCIGVLACLFWFSVTYLRCYAEFQTSLPVSNPALTEWLSTHPLKRRITIRQSDRISSPLTYGLFRPVILVPKKTDWENTAQLNYVLQHEYQHIRCFDALWKLVTTFALCIHWFNPLVWAMYFLFQRDIELACDERVIQNFGETSRAAYARTLITMEEMRPDYSPLYNSFSKTAIEERIKAIMKHKKTTHIASLFSAFLLVAVAMLFCTCAKANTATGNSGTPSSGVNSSETIPDGSYAATVKGCTEDTLLLDFLEYVTDDDTERKAELIEELQLEEGIDLADGNFLDGYYIYDEDSSQMECKVADDVLIQLINYDAKAGDPYYNETSDLAVFLDQIFSEYGWSKLPYFFEIKDGVITSIHEKFIP